MTRPLVVATNNLGKLEELRHILGSTAFELRSLREVSSDPVHVVEDGDTLEANALKKARAVAALTGMLTLADDTGLEVDALGGAPGVRSARFAGEHATDAENMAALLDALRGAPGMLTARFRCVLALVDPAGAEPLLAEGRCEGSITLTPRGEAGFGYDPIFVVAGGDRTLAELSKAEKNRISHRALAAAELRARLAETSFAKEVEVDAETKA